MTNHYLLLIAQFVGFNAIYVQYVLQCMSVPIDNTPSFSSSSTISVCKANGKVHSVAGHERPEGE